MPIIDGWEQRIEAVLGDDNELCTRNSQRWRQHLLKNLTLPLLAIGIEEFPWEEPYVFGAWDAGEYEELKKTNPSYTDEFDLIDIGEPGESDDLIAKVRRVSDKRMFDIGLSWLMTTLEEGPAYTVMSDYAVWHCNF